MKIVSYVRIGFVFFIVALSFMVSLSLQPTKAYAGHYFSTKNYCALSSYHTVGCDLIGIDLTGKDLSNIDLVGVDMSYSD